MILFRERKEERFFRRDKEVPRHSRVSRARPAGLFHRSQQLSSLPVYREREEEGEATTENSLPFFIGNECGRR